MSSDDALRARIDEAGGQSHNCGKQGEEAGSEDSRGKSVADDQTSSTGIQKRKRDKAESAEDALLPHEPLARVMRRALQPSTNIERTAVRTVQACISELVMVVIGEATERVLTLNPDQSRRLLSADDVMWALRELGFEVYTASLETLLKKYLAQQQQSEK
jgi:histone H3/H4